MNPKDFLDVADELIAPRPGRPRQANLRRAKSSIYYAVLLG